MKLNLGVSLPVPFAVFLGEFKSFFKKINTQQIFIEEFLEPDACQVVGLQIGIRKDGLAASSRKKPSGKHLNTQGGIRWRGRRGEVPGGR